MSTVVQRERWLIKLLQMGMEEEPEPRTWRELVRRAVDYGLSARIRPHPWEFDALRTRTIGSLYELHDEVREYLSPSRAKPGGQ
jgi:hypothetical protein